MRLIQSKVIEKCREVHGNKYDYSKVIFTRTIDKIEIVCPEGHSFYMTPSNHYHIKHPQGCPICSGKGPGKDGGVIFLAKAHKVFEDLFEYGQYIDSKTHMDMRCTTHDIRVSQSPTHHLMGKNPCRSCTADKLRSYHPSPYNITKATRGDFNFPSEVYLIRLTNTDESFLKVGISKDTSKRVREFIGKGYSVEILLTKPFLSCNDAIMVEQSMHVLFEEHSYIPRVTFKGMFECFTEDILEESIARLGDS